ncbi:MAG TPA: C1 family peptidase [Bacteroidales bacterium]|nr:C1 family peptidase [Bacteroidales bacterium]
MYKYEGKVRYTGSYKPAEPLPAEEYIPTEKGRALPTSFSWTTQGGCTPCMNQGSCGSCWACAAVGAFECNIKIIDKATKRLSEQWFVDCDNTYNGCSGGWCPFDHFQTSGAVYGADYAYTGTAGTCKSNVTFREKIDSYKEISSGIATVDQIKDAIYNYGPVWTSYNAASGTNNYSGGVMTTNESGSPNHAICLVGWNDNNGTNGYFILRNSWGTSWGVENGYMYIKYGICSLGYKTSYIVYKGGIPHEVAPVANFSATSTTSCTGTIQFADSSSNAPTEWLWNFGDGTTSTLQNPSHTYTSNGTYNVSLKATNAYGNNSKTKNSFISINMPFAPTASGATINSGNTATLTASGSGTLNWYDAASGGNLLGTGNSYTTPPLYATTSYYVENTTIGTIQSVGITEKTANGGYYTSTGAYALVFNALTDLTIKTVKVYSGAADNEVVISLTNSSGTIINTKTLNLINGEQTITLDFNVPAGTDYKLGADASCNLWRESAGATYPYTVSNLISITGNTASSAESYYYYFYDWKVQSTGCSSARTPVTVVISGIHELSSIGSKITPNPNQGFFSIEFNNYSNDITSLTIENSLGQVVLKENIETTFYKKNFDLSNLTKGIYIIKLSGTEKVYYGKMIIE